MKIQKILLLIDNLTSGGAQRQFVGLAAMLKQSGYDVQAAGYFNDSFYLPYLQENDVQYTYVKEAQSTKTRIWRMHGFIKKMKPDMVIAYLDTPCILACLSKMMGGNFKLIVSERNTTQILSRTSHMKFFLYRFADAIVPNSFSQERFIKKHYPHLSSKVNTITNFIDTEQFRPVYHSENSPLRMICVGRITRQKNLPNFLNALNIVRRKGFELKVDWFGRPDDETTWDVMNEIIRKFQLQDMFTVHAPTISIVDKYNQADIFCLPSLYEGFPNVLCEAMCCEKPTICSRVCDNPDIVQDGRTGYMFEPNNPEDIADKIIQMISLPIEQRKEMGRLGRELILNLCSSSRFIEKYLELIKRNYYE